MCKNTAACTISFEERKKLEEKLSGGDKSKIARSLGISAFTVQRYFQKDRLHLVNIETTINITMAILKLLKKREKQMETIKSALNEISHVQ